ncbi:hypothetical protein ACLOJK_025721 [Asimina triloba]
MTYRKQLKSVPEIFQNQAFLAAMAVMLSALLCRRMGEKRMHLRMDMPEPTKEDVRMSEEQNTLIIEEDGPKESDEEDGGRKRYSCVAGMKLQMNNGDLMLRWEKKKGTMFFMRKSIEGKFLQVAYSFLALPTTNVSHPAQLSRRRRLAARVSSVAGGIESSRRMGKRKQRSNNPCLFQTAEEGGESGRLILSATAGNQKNPTSATDVNTHPLVLSAAVEFEKLLATAPMLHVGSGDSVFLILSHRARFVCSLQSGRAAVESRPTIGALDVFDQMPKRNLASVNLVSGIMKMMSISALIHLYVEEDHEHPIDHLLQNPNLTRLNPAIKVVILKPPSDRTEDANVIIGGTGLASLAATRHLLSLGFKVAIVEGDGVVVTADLGASVLTGINGNPLGVLARQLWFPLHKVRDKCPMYLPNGKFVDPDIDLRVEFTFNRLLYKVRLQSRSTKELANLEYANAALAKGGLAENSCHRLQLANDEALPFPSLFSQNSIDNSAEWETFVAGRACTQKSLAYGQAYASTGEIHKKRI